MSTTTDKSRKTNVTVNGNGNQVITNSKNVIVNSAKGAKLSAQWLQIIYWVVGIVLALIGIYKFFID